MHDLQRVSPRMVKAQLPVSGDAAEWRERIGRVIERTRTHSQLTLKQFADAIGRDERQIARWIGGVERPQIDAICAVDRLREAFIVALAELAGDGVQVVTEIRLARCRR